MKKSIISAISKLTLGIALTTGAGAVHAQSSVISADKNAEIKYLGTSNAEMLFNVAYDNPNGNKFSVILLDQDGTSLFQEIFTDKKFDKRFRLPLTDKERVTFVIRNFKDVELKQSFDINTRVTEDFVVTKVN